MERNHNGGFTLLETLLTVAILVILLGVSAVGVAYYKDYLKITELDNTARDIYMAAENRAVLLQNSGASATLLSLGGSGDIELSKTATQLDDLLPKGTIDPILWEGERDFRVVYDQTTGHVKEVFYAEKGIDSNLDDLRAKSRSTRVSLFRGGKTLVGYYGSAVGDPIATKPLPTPGVEVFIDNGEELTLKVTYTQPEGLPAGVTYTPSVELDYQGTKVSLLKDNLSNYPNRRPSNVNGGFGTGNYITYTWVLDSLAKDAGGTSQQFKDLKSGGLTGLGGNFKVTAGLTLKADGWIDGSYYAQGTDNSLFAKGSNSGADQGTAYIAYLRHLQNLYLYYSKASGVNTKKAVQIATIYGTFKGALYEFKPIHNMDLLSYNGYTEETVPNGKEPYVISGLTVTKASADERGDGVSNLGSGLFGFMNEDFELRNVRLFDSRIEGRGRKDYGFTGALVGNISSVTMENCWVKNVTVVGVGNENYDYTGGLLGRCWYTATLKNCVAENVTVTSDRTAGGLVGLVDVSGGCVIENCRVYWTDPGKLVEGGGLQYKIHGRTDAGGLIGEIRNNGTSAVTIKSSFAATTIYTYSSSQGNTGGLVGYGGSMTIENSYADCYLGGKLNVGGLVSARQNSSVLKLENSYAAGFIVKSNESPVNGGSAGLCNSSAAAQNCYSAVRVLKTDGTLEKPATPMYSGWNESSPGSAFYLSQADEAADEVKTALGSAFEYEDATPETHVYDLRHKLSGKAEDALTPPYPFPGLKDTAGAPMPHYGDWAELENKKAAPAGLAYYEVYQDSASPGVWGVLENGADLQDLKDDTDNPVVTKDGYALAFEGTEAPENYKVQYGAASTQIWTLKDLEWENGSDVQTVEKLTVPTGGKTYTLIPLPDKVVTEAWAGITQHSSFYQKMVCGEGTDARTYWFNPHFAKTVKKSDSAPAKPSDSPSSAIIVRTPRHLWHMSAILYDDNISHQFYPGQFYYYYKQELDLDYGRYEGYPGIFEPKAGELPFIQLPIGSGGGFSSGSIMVGTYDGGCHIIQNVLFSKSSALRYIGLFGASQGTLKNIVYQMDPTKQHEANMRAYDSQNQSAGMLLGYNRGTVDNCAVYGANIKTILTRRDTDTNIVAYNYTGGLVGNNYQGTIRNCSAEAVYLQAESIGNSNFTGGFVGGLAGKNSGTISSCYAVGKAVAKDSDYCEAAGLVPTHYSGGKITNSYAAVNLECKNRFGLCRNSSDCTVDEASGWLTGTFKYRGEKYTVEGDTYTGMGTAMTSAQLAERLPTLAAAANTVKNFPSSWPGGKDYSADYTENFPYLTGVKDGTGAVHYGLWPAELLPSPGLVYYEAYGSGSSRTYGVEGVLEDGTEIEDLKDIPPSVDGYALIFQGNEDKIAKPLTVTYQTQAYTLGGTAGSLYWAASADASSGEEVKAFSYTTDSESYTLVPLPAEVVTGPLGNRDAFYQKLGWKVKDNTGDFWFNPHFAKTVHTEQPAEPETEASAASVRTPRHFWNLGAISYKSNISIYQIYRDYCFKQELDLDFKTYDTASMGIDLKNYTPIGCETGSAFGGTYDGQGHSIQNLGSGTGEQFVSHANPFGYSKGTLKNIVYHMNAFNISKIPDGSLSRVGGLVGCNMTGGVVESCRVRIASGEVIDGAGNISLGGLVGWNQGDIKNSRVTGEDTPKDSAKAVSLNAVKIVGNGIQTHVGGLVGTNEGGAITFDSPDGCSATIGELTNPSYWATAGGVVGENKGGKNNEGKDVEGLMYGWTVEVEKLSGGGFIGGLVGENNNGGKVNECVVNVASLTIPQNNSGHTGGLAGFNDAKGTIENCEAKVENLLKEKDNDRTIELGGLVGWNRGKIAGCRADVTDLQNQGSIGMGDYNKVGGLAGFNDASGAIENCEASVNALTNTGRYARVGGAAGQNNGAIRGTVTTVTTTLTNRGEEAYVGGLAGVNNTNGTIENCTVTVNGPLTNAGGSARVGGVAGENSSGATVTDCMVTLTGLLTNNGESALVGGVAGRNNGTIQGTEEGKCSVTANTLTSTGRYAYVGGVAGQNNGATVTNCTVAVTGSLTNSGRYAKVGGLVGSSGSNSIVEGCAAELTACTLINEEQYVSMGGLIGENTGKTVADCNVNVKEILNRGNESNVTVGGLIGYNRSNQGTVKACTVNVIDSLTNTGHDTKVGGLIGWLYSGTVESCRATVPVLENGESGNKTAMGGLIGKHSSNRVSECSAVVGDLVNKGLNAHVGGLVGSADSFFSNCDVKVSTLTNTLQYGYVGILSGTWSDYYFENCTHNGTSEDVNKGYLMEYPEVLEMVPVGIDAAVAANTADAAAAALPPEQPEGVKGRRKKSRRETD